MSLRTTALPALLFILLLPFMAAAQDKKKDPEKLANKIFNFQFHYTYEFPGGDLAQRFGTIHNIGFGGLLKTKTNWLVGLDASYQFGSDVKEDILYNLTNSNYQTISNNAGYPATISMGERGINFFLKGGKVFAISKENRNSGIVVMAGGGYLSHKVNISVSQNNVPSLTDDLKKGYDRLTMGWAVTEFIGYYFQSESRLVNFYIGVDMMQAFTQSVRGYNYDQMAYDKARRTDLFLGPRIGWMIPIYMTTKDQDEFFYR